jgi:hypothetical protein
MGNPSGKSPPNKQFSNCSPEIPAPHKIHPKRLIVQSFIAINLGFWRDDLASDHLYTSTSLHIILILIKQAHFHVPSDLWPYQIQDVEFGQKTGRKPGRTNCLTWHSPIGQTLSGFLSFFSFFFVQTSSIIIFRLLKCLIDLGCHFPNY